jgi:hypothetical protein
VSDAPADDRPLATLQDHLDAGYAHTVGVLRRRVDPVHDLARAGFDRTDMEARHAALDAVATRCVISRVQRDFLRRALDLIG